ncbi:hypothetical protein V6N13_118201 [Hibiscus sabdariffa]
MDLLRSEPMQLVQLIIPVESAHCSISYLGDLGLFQFKDLNSEKSPFQRTYATQIKRCGEMARKLRFFKEQMTKAGLSPYARSAMSDDVYLDNLEVKLGELEAELIEMNANNEKLQHSYNELIEYKLVVQKASEFFHSAQNHAAVKQREVEAHQSGEGSIDSPLLLEQEMVTDPSKQVKLGFVSGIIQREKSLAFERILFRATRGNVFLKQSAVEGPVTDPASGEKAEKNVFVVFYSGERVRNKIVKICEAFGANRYSFTEDLGKQFQIIAEVKKEKSIYHTLNMLSIDVTRKCLVAEVTKLKNESSSLILQIQNVLQQATVDSNAQIGTVFHVLQTKESPPTYFHTNKFTSAFQEIVDAYGISKYQEANPGVFTIITFPFLFAVMFGDWGHGLLYNEFFSVPFELFAPSAYGCRDPSCRDATTAGLVKVRATYPFGVDPKWHGTRSELPFLNSMKMKMSILLGVAQMNLGIILSYFNAKFYGNELNIRLFGYLSLLIVVKWCTGSQADLYHVMIYMFLSPTDDLGENQLFFGQKFLQILLLLAALVSVPWMLFPKPFLLKKQHDERHRGQSYALLETNLDDSDGTELHHGSSSHEEFQFSEIFVHQLIHTIEFVLGAVSNTASYLRLWALSLAHSELSSVFYDKVLLLAWGFNNITILIIGLIVFICATVGVLLVMETLSAFLHALRLHWVEFQGKFYEGEGYKFQPFSFASLGKEDE